jgi:hypothetical protein
MTGVTTNDLITRGYQPYGYPWWRRPESLELVHQDVALAEVAAQLQPAAQEEQEDEPRG